MKQRMPVDIEAPERVAPPLPDRTSVPRAELAAQVRAAPAFVLLRRLATWAVGSRLTSRGELTLGEARRAVTRLGLPGDQGPNTAPARSAADFPELAELWQWAVATDMVRSDGATAMHGQRFPVLHGGADDDVLELWTVLVEEELHDWWAAYPLGFDLVAALAVCYRAPAGCTPADLVGGAVAAMDRSGWPLEGAAVEDSLELMAELLDSLSRLALVITEKDTARLTGLGAWALRPWLGSGGQAFAAEPDQVVGGRR